MRKILAILFMMLATQAVGLEKLCTNNVIKFDVCKDAERIVRETAKHLPYKPADQVQIISFSSNGNVITQGVKLLYSRNFFEKAIIQQGRSLDEMKMQMFKNSQDITCMNEISKAFLDLGGHMRFLYEFSDGEYLYELYVSAC
ncbi:MAG: hypothetical protein P8P53_10380 [Tateyamaria sp.]|nr:hypothetical protein [Tateyamaria sp.]